MTYILSSISIARSAATSTTGAAPLIDAEAKTVEVMTGSTTCHGDYVATAASEKGLETGAPPTDYA